MFVNAVIFLGLCLASGVTPGQAYRYIYTLNESYTGGMRVRRAAGGCVLPEYSHHGSYVVDEQPDATPGQTYNMFVALTVTCNDGYGVTGNNTIYCIRNKIWQWSQPIPQCSRLCKLTPHPSVNYQCKETGTDYRRGTRPCRLFEPSGTVVVPECNRLYIYSGGILYNLYCNNGAWNHIAICQPDCGTPTPTGTQLILNGVSVLRGELPWHAAIYDKVFRVNKQICGGSLISTTVVISAAHCFWKDAVGKRPANEYAVALGKIYRPWDDPLDSDVHKSDVSEIHIPIYFMGERGRFQDDIALVILSTPVVYANHIRPVCIDFGDLFDRTQLQHANLGKVAGWGLTSEDGAETRVLQTTALPYVEVAQCIRELPLQFKQYVTNDKICAGGTNGTALCKGDSGGGLVFLERDRGIDRYYLRGVASTAPTSESGHACNAYAYTTFTHILNHAKFIADYGLAVGSIDNRATTPVPEAACPAVAPELTTAPTGSKAWDKCLEYQEQLIYPCEESTTGGKQRNNHCKHNSDELIGGRQAAQRNEFPHVVLLCRGQPDDTERTVWCAGTLISDRFILTYAYCVDQVIDLEDFYAVVDILNIRERITDSQVYRLKRIIRHPQYAPPALYNNIALLETVDQIRLGPSVVPACLDVFGGDHSIAVHTSWRTGSLVSLHKETITKSADDACRQRYLPGRFSSLAGGVDAATQVCYTRDDNVCLNISAPLTVKNRRVHCMYSVVGVPVHGRWSNYYCYNAAVPYLFTRVASYVPWIEGIVWP